MTLKNYISLTDGVTPVLEKIADTAGKMSKRIVKVKEEVEKTGNATVTTTEKVVNATRKVNKTEPPLNRTSKAVKQVTNHLHEMGDEADHVGQKMDVFAGSLGAQFAMEGLRWLKDVAMGGLNSLIALSDEYAGINARLKLIAGSQENATHLNDRIFESAQRARAGYLDVADSVGKLAMGAKDAFPDPREAVDFAEGINKLFAIGGASAENKKSAMLQLTQGMASGQLQGDEFKSIAENAPIIENMIAKTMGVSRGELKKLASEGKITAEVIKESIMGNMAEIDEQFKEIPKTWSDNWTYVKNESIKALAPIGAYISNLANNSIMQEFADNAVSAMRYAAPWIMWGIEQIQNGVVMLNGAFSFVKNNSWILGSALVLLSAWFANLAISVTAARMPLLLDGAAKAFAAVQSGILTASIIALEFAQHGLNAAIAMCPMTWIIGAIVALIGVLYLGVAAVNYFADTNISATGLIFGAFSWMFANIWNMIAFSINKFIAFANFLGGLFQNPLAAIHNFFADIWNGIVDLVGVHINKIIDLINKLPGMKLGHVEKMSIDTSVARVSSLSYANPYEWANTGYKKGESLSQMVNGTFDMKMDTPKAWDEKVLDAVKGEHMSDKDSNNLDKTAKNTDRMADAISMTEEEIKNLKDIALGDTLQQWQNQHIKIDFSNVNNISNEMDLDGVTDRIMEGIKAAVTMQGEGVRA